MISIIIPTIGRPTLKRTLLSILPDGPMEVLVVSDGKQKQASKIVKQVKKKVPYTLRYIRGPKTNRWGNTQRNLGMEKAQGDWLLFIDDDDIFIPDAFKILTPVLRDNPGKPVIFRMRDWHGYILWRKRKMQLGNVGGAMIALPNNVNRLAKWPDTDDYGSDAHFIHSVLSKYHKKDLVWIEDCLYICRPEI